MICAKNEETLKFLQKQFSDRKVQKTYIAVVGGTPNPDEAIIDAPITRNPKNPKTFKVAVEGKSAQTHYKVLRTVGKYSIVELKPKTGRTHQLRVHLNHINHSIVGDELYSSEKNDRLLLHAYRLSLLLPDGESQEFVAPLPSEIERYIDAS
jgi:23S rRNA pseudouridine1911/1915/1917 synthase